MNRQEKAQIMDLCGYQSKRVDVCHIAVQSMTDKSKSYMVTLNGDELAVSCTCRDFMYRGEVGACKHMLVVQLNVLR